MTLYTSNQLPKMVVSIQIGAFSVPETLKWRETAAERVREMFLCKATDAGNSTPADLLQGFKAGCIPVVQFSTMTLHSYQMEEGEGFPLREA